MAKTSPDLIPGAGTGELAGVPFAVKAMIDVEGLVTTAGSALYRDAAPAAPSWEFPFTLDLRLG